MQQRDLAARRTAMHQSCPSSGVERSVAFHYEQSAIASSAHRVNDWRSLHRVFRNLTLKLRGFNAPSIHQFFPTDQLEIVQKSEARAKRLIDILDHSSSSGFLVASWLNSSVMPDAPYEIDTSCMRSGLWKNVSGASCNEGSAQLLLVTETRQRSRQYTPQVYSMHHMIGLL